MLNQHLSGTFVVEGDQRGNARRRLRLSSRVQGTADAGLIIHNLSRTGMLVECTAGVPAGSVIAVELPDGGTHNAQVVWADETLFGARFAKPLTQAQLSAALLRADPDAPESGSPRLTQAEALARLRQHWDDEPEAVAPPSDRKLPLAVRMWAIGGLAVTGWAVPAAAAWLFW